MNFKYKNFKNIAIIMVIIIPLLGFSQENKTENTIRIKTIRVIDGKEILRDTTFTVIEGENANASISRINWIDDSKGGISSTIDVQVENSNSPSMQNDQVFVFGNEDNDNIEVVEDGNSKIIIIRKERNRNFNQEDFRGSGQRQPKVMTWISDDSVQYQVEIERNMERMRRRGEMRQLSMVDMQRQIEERLSTVESLTEEQKQDVLNLFNEMDFPFEMSAIPPMPPMDEQNFEFYPTQPNERGVSDRELRDAGVKNKPDRLELKNINININNGVVDISFMLDVEANPKIVVYNIYGDKIFSGAPVLLNGNFQIKNDLSAKQHGTYYWQIIDKNRSFTDKFKL